MTILKSKTGLKYKTGLQSLRLDLSLRLYLSLRLNLSLVLNLSSGLLLRYRTSITFALAGGGVSNVTTSIFVLSSKNMVWSLVAYTVGKRTKNLNIMYSSLNITEGGKNPQLTCACKLYILEMAAIVDVSPKLRVVTILCKKKSLNRIVIWQKVGKQKYWFGLLS